MRFESTQSDKYRRQFYTMSIYEINSCKFIPRASESTSHVFMARFMMLDRCFSLYIILKLKKNFCTCQTFMPLLYL